MKSTLQASSGRGGQGVRTLSPADWHRTGHYLSFNGLNLFVTVQGTGQPVLVLHGFPTSSYDHSRIVTRLSDQFQFILFDYPGFGFSDKPRRYPYSLFRYADAAEFVARHFGLTRIFLLAHDIGDSVALELLSRHTLTVDRLVLMNGSVYSIPFTDPVMLLVQRLWLNRLTGSLISRLRLLQRPTFARMFLPLFTHLSASDLDAFWSLVRYNDGVGIYHLLMRYMHDRWQHQSRWLDTLQSHTAPLTVIWGQADPIATPAVADVITQRRPDATDIRLDSIGHYPQWEAPDVVASTIRAAFEP